VVLALGGFFAAAAGVGEVAHLPLPDLSALSGSSADAAAPSAAPARITIPALDVRARVVTVGQADDGSIATPDQDPVRTVGWYELGPSPGDRGTAVIVGHVDSQDEAAVFARLAELSPGDRIEVTRGDGQVESFAVDSLRRTPKTAFPARTIFAPSPKPRLVLVTCGGAWLGGDVGYADNVLVFATRID